MDLFTADFLYDLLTIILLDLVLAGDNAIVIAMAASRLPVMLQRKAVFWATFGAVAIRFALTAVVVYLLKLPGLMLIGGLLLLPIARKLLRHGAGTGPAIDAGGTFWGALRTIIVADALMGMDNVLAIAGASSGHLGLVILGLLISVPLVAWGSTLILKLIGRFPIIIYIGAGAIAFTAGQMITHDPWLESRLEMPGWLKYAVDVTLVIGVCGGSWLRQRRLLSNSSAG